MTPAIGFDPLPATNDPPFMGLDNTYGLIRYPNGAGSSELWCFLLSGAGPWYFTGLVYGDTDDYCAADPCENGGTCTNEPGGYSCACPPTHTGTNCEIPTGTGAVLASNPTSYWRLGESSGTVATAVVGVNGTYVGGPTLGVAGAFPSDPNTAAAWNGSSTYAQLTWSASPSFSVEAWARSNTANWNTYGWIASDRAGNGFILHPQVSSRQWIGYVVNSSGAFTSVGGHTPASITGWHQYVLAYDHPSRVATMYFDGAQVAQATLGSMVRGSSTNTNFRVGSDTCCGTRIGNGASDEISTYNRALTPAEVLAHFNAGIQ